MPQANDDRLSSFITREGMVSDANFMLALLNGIKKSIKNVGTIRFKLEDAQGLRQTSDLIGKLSTQYAELTRQKHLLVNETERLTAALRGEKDAAQGATLPNRTTATHPQPAGTSGPSLTDEADVEEASSAYKELKKSVDAAWASYTNLIASSGLLAEETQKALVQYKALKQELQALEQLRQLKIDLGTMDNLGPDIKAKIELLERLEAEFGQLKARIDAADEEGLDALVADAERLQTEISQLTTELIQFTGTAQKAQKAGSFEGLVAEAKNAKKVFQDMRADMASGSGKFSTADLDQAFDKWQALQAQITAIKAAEKDAFRADGVRQQAAAVSVLEREISRYEGLIKAAKTTMAELAQTNVGRHSQGYKEAAAAVSEFSGKLAVAQSTLAKISKLEKDRQLAQRAGKKAIKDTEDEISAAKKLESIYNALKESLKQLQAEAAEIEARNFLQIAQPGDAEQLAKVRNNITELSGAIGKIDVALGKGQRHNLAYTQQLFSLQQVIRELPNAAFGFSTLISALSNNIPILNDDLERLKARNKELAAAGLPVISVTEQIVKVIFSWQTALIVVITLLTSFSDEIGDYVVSLFRSEAANRKAYQATEKYAEIQRELAQATKELTEAFQKLNNIRAQSTDMGIRQLERQLEVMQALGVSADKLLGLEQQRINLIQNKAAIQVATTSEGIAEQRLQVGRINIAQDLANLRALNKEMLQAKKDELNASDVFSTSPNGTVQKTLTKAEVEEIAKRKQVELKAQIDVAKARVDASAQGIREAKGFTAQIKQLAKDAADGRITEEQRAAKEETLRLAFLERERKLANERSAQSNQKFRQAELDLMKEGLRVEEQRGDKNKDDKFKAAKEKKEAAERQFQTDEELNQQALEALDAHNDSIKERDAQLNKARKILSDEHRKVVLANAEAEATRIEATNQDILANEESTLNARLEALAKLKQSERELALARFNDVKTNFSSSDADIEAARVQLAAELKAIDIKYARESIETQFEYYVRYNKAIRDLREADLSYQIRINEQIRDSIEETLETRLKAERNAANARRQLAKDQFEQQLVEAGFSKKDIEQLEAGNQAVLKGKRLTVAELEAIVQRHNRTLNALTLDGIKTNTDILKAEYDRQEADYSEHLQRIEQLSEGISFDNSNDLVEQEIVLRDSLRRREINVFQYEKQLEKVRLAAQQRELEQQAAHVEDIIDLLEKQFGDRKAIENKIRIGEAIVDSIREQLKNPNLSDDQRIQLQADLSVNQEGLDSARQKLAELITLFGKLTGLKRDKQQLIAEEEVKRLQRAQEIMNNIATVMGSLNAILGSFAERGFAIRAAQIEKEMELIQKRNDREREMIEQSVASEEERSKLLGALRVQEESDRERLERKRKKLEYDRAKQEKQAALVTIGIELAKTLANITFEIAKAAASLNPVKAAVAASQYAVAIAAAAAQTAAVASKPLPAYALGTKNHPGGPALVGDAYKSELVVTKEGKLMVTKASPYVTDLPEGAQVYPDARKALSDMADGQAAKKALAQKAGSLVPEVLPTSDRLQLMQRLMAEQVLSQTIQRVSSLGVSVNVPGMDKLSADIRKGFAQLNKTIKGQKPVNVLRMGNVTQFFIHGSNYDKR